MNLFIESLILQMEPDFPFGETEESNKGSFQPEPETIPSPLLFMR
jgi:hypothetical protein